MATLWVQAQTLDSIPYHHVGTYLVLPNGITQLDDGNVVGCFWASNVDSATYNMVPVGGILHKLTRHGAVVSDTALVETVFMPTMNVFGNPDGGGNVLVEMGNDFKWDNPVLRIHRFDDNLVFDTANVITVPLFDTTIRVFEQGATLTPDGDLLIAFSDYDEDLLQINDVYFSLYGLDGTLKQQKRIPHNMMPFDLNYAYGPTVFSRSPLRYCCWGRMPSDILNLSCYVMDSVFDIVRLYVFSNFPYEQGFHISLNYGERVLGLDNGEFLFAFCFDKVMGLDHGVMVRKYGSGFNLLKERRFYSDAPQEYTPYAKPIGLERGHDGSIYLAYFTSGCTYDNRVSVVKMDEDLNVIWQRYCLDPHGYRGENGYMIVLDDNAVAITGNVVNPDSGVFYIIVNDDYDGMEEQDLIVRPYAYYPNPAQDELHLQYSPDVTPSQIELFDIQGRLLRLHRNGLESLNLQGLPSGTYTMRVTLEGGKVFSEKVVKK